MGTIEIILIVIAVACIIVSFVMPAVTPRVDTSKVDIELSEYQLEQIRIKVNDAVSQELDHAIESTEVSLDKVTNSKILEMQEYADTVFAEMNKNHNETLFLYDMLNDKSKEIKILARDMAKIKELEENTEKAKTTTSKRTTKKDTAVTDEVTGTETKKTTKRTTKTSKTSKTAADTEVVTQKDIDENLMNKLIKQATDEEMEDLMNSKNGKGASASNTEKILAMYKEGKSVLEIAKELNLGIGQTKLVIDLAKESK